MGRLKWPNTLLGETATKKCPYSREFENKNAFRECRANFTLGPKWQLPFVADCPKKSETTRKLKDLSEVIG